MRPASAAPSALPHQRQREPPMPEVAAQLAQHFVNGERLLEPGQHIRLSLLHMLPSAGASNEHTVHGSFIPSGVVWLDQVCVTQEGKGGRRHVMPWTRLTAVRRAVLAVAAAGVAKIKLLPAC